jgi:hypothetical protein
MSFDQLNYYLDLIGHLYYDMLLVDVIFSVANNGAGTAYTSTAPNLTPVFSEVRVAQS